MNILEIKNHPKYNSKSLRIHLSQEEIKSLSLKIISENELRNLECEADFNPTYFYKERMEINIGEVGHDLEYRYIIK